MEDRQARLLGSSSRRLARIRLPTAALRRDETDAETLIAN